jgi:hypothetical protein
VVAVKPPPGPLLKKHTQIAVFLSVSEEPIPILSGELTEVITCFFPDNSDFYAIKRTTSLLIYT